MTAYVAGAAALLAVLEQNDARWRRILAGMLPGELEELADACDALAEHARRQFIQRHYEQQPHKEDS